MDEQQAGGTGTLEGSCVRSAAAYWLRAPLTRAYELSFGTLRAFDLVLVRLVDGEGRIGFGESCPVPPYSPESADQVWSRVCEVLSKTHGREPATVLNDLVQRGDGCEAFSYVAPTTAFEALLESAEPAEELAVPIVGTVQASTESELPAEVSRLVDLGHRTLKVKVGFDPSEDLRRVSTVRRYAPDEVQLRLDANEAWDLRQAEQFLNGLDPNGIELLEQPLPRDHWDWFASLANEHRHVPLMLDEAVGSDASVRRAADSGAGIVKFKLMKAGSRQVLRRRVGLATSLGLSVVVGNGIAGVCDNWYEAVDSQATGRAGEMNGNLKLADAVFADRPTLRDGMLCFPAGFTLSFDRDLLASRSYKAAIWE